MKNLINLFRPNAARLSSSIHLTHLFKANRNSIDRGLRAVAILVMGYLGIFGLLSMLNNSLSAMQSFYAAKQDLLASLEERNGQNGLNESSDGRARENPFFSASTETLAAAELDEKIREAAKETNGIVLSSQAEVGHDDDNSRDRIEIKATIESTNDDIQALLFRLETGTPFIFVKELALQPKHVGNDSSNGDTMLHANVTLVAYWKDPAPKAQQP